MRQRLSYTILPKKIGIGAIGTPVGDLQPFPLIQHEGDVHVLIDFREQTRESMPAGINAHLMSFGSSISPKLSGKAVVLGLPEADKAQLMLDEDGSFETKTGRLYFAGDEAEAQALFDSF